MAVTVSARLSTDAGNQLGFGTDTGLFGAVPVARGGSPTWVFDNSWPSPAGTTYYYTPATGASAQASIAAGTAYVWPFMFSRAARLTALTGYVWTAGAGSTLYHSSFTSDATTGLPGTKIIDVANLSGATAANSVYTMTDTATTYAANTLYWMCSWTYTTSALPSIAMRNLSFMQGIRMPSAPTGSTYFSSGGVFSLLDTSQTWASRTTAPTTLNPAAPAVAAPGNGVYAPQLVFGLANV